MVFGLLLKKLNSMEVILVKFSLGQNMKEKETVLISFTIVERFTIELAKNYTTFIHGKYIFILQCKIVRTLMNSNLFQYQQPRKVKLSQTSHHNCCTAPSYHLLCCNTAH